MRGILLSRVRDELVVLMLMAGVGGLRLRAFVERRVVSVQACQGEETNLR